MKLSRLLIISRPVFWPLTFCSYLLGIGHLANFGAVSVFELFLFSFPLNLFIYGLNDVYDRKSDELNPRKGDTQGAVIKKDEEKSLKMIVIIPALLLFIVSLVSRNLEHILFVLLFLFSGFAYSHPILRLKGKPIIDSLTSTVVYFSPLLVAYSLHDSVINIDPKLLLLLLPPTGVHAITTLKDMEYDEKAGTYTIGVFLRESLTLIFALFMFILPLIFFLDNPMLVSVLAIGSCIVLYLLLTKAKYDKEFVFGMASGLIVLWILSLVYPFVVNNF